MYHSTIFEVVLPSWLWVEDFSGQICIYGPLSSKVEKIFYVDILLVIGMKGG